MIKYVRMEITVNDDPDLCLRCSCGREFWSGPAPEECVVFIRDAEVDGKFPDNHGRLYPECPECFAVHRPGYETHEEGCSTKDPSCFFQAGCDCGADAT